MYMCTIMQIMCSSMHLHAVTTISIHSTQQEGCGGVTGDSVTMPLLVTLCGHLKCRKLRLLDLHTDSTLNCVTFDPTYYDTETSRYSWPADIMIANFCILQPFIITHVHAVPAHVCTYSIRSQRVCVRSKLSYTCWYSPIHALALTLQASDPLQ